MEYESSLIKFINDYRRRHVRVKIYRGIKEHDDMSDLTATQLEWIMSVLEELNVLNVDKDIVEAKIDPLESVLILLLMKNGRIEIVSSKKETIND